MTRATTMWRSLVRDRPYLATCTGVLALGSFTAAWTIGTSSATAVALEATWLAALWAVQMVGMGTAAAVVATRRPPDRVVRVVMTCAVLLFVLVLCGGIWVEPDRFGPLSARVMLVVAASGAIVRSWPLAGAVAAGSISMWWTVFSTVSGPHGGWTEWPLTWLLSVALSGSLVFVVTGERRQSAELTGRLRHQARVDPLTGLLNRAGLRHQAMDLIDDAERAGGWVTASFVDVDGMKSVNDTYGHGEGDRLLRLIADALRRSTRSSDLVGRWGGDEFIVVSRDRDAAEAGLAARVAEAVELDPGRPAWWLPGTARITVGSAAVRLAAAGTGRPGAAVAGGGSVQVLDELIASADAAMYRERATRRRATT